VARIYQKVEESSEEPCARLRLVPSYFSYLLVVKEYESSFTMFVSKVAATLSGISSFS